ncbi:hypothetical protein [Kibdelosporangium phytohabitans]|uniref:Uncharacterized protein n=1 Tax=Kibdelosporangium phytohabitans TaxID=860235 RepID=A0A0N9HYQ3_9PSEU|nr:hypothetical protein [Kibdelosporangium phytohabitans]ALG08403.1 hypothetical protein AOZ06_17120 [Kibdelosporangium phytohabitans]MBE1470548.1 hypothetical protein [Kibdelosporangium phytohabitans]
MADDELRQAGFEQVHVENSRYDGPQTGVADVGGVPHYFERQNRFFEDGDEFVVWLIDEVTLALEREQWRVFVATWDAGHAGSDDPDADPNAGVLPDRYHELTKVLEPRRVAPDDTRTMYAQWRLTGSDRRHDDNGPSYLMRWREPDSDAT